MNQSAIETLAETIRRYSLVSIHAAKSGHPGGALSCADVLAVLYGAELGPQGDDVPENERHRFIMSKGHACPALYAAWAATDMLDPRELPRFAISKDGSKVTHTSAQRRSRKPAPAPLARGCRLPAAWRSAPG
jgi:transketolase N-terminal domain/subunit